MDIYLYCEKNYYILQIIPVLGVARITVSIIIFIIMHRGKEYSGIMPTLSEACGRKVHVSSWYKGTCECQDML